ncbi:sensor histidine kinase [Demequina flava]|uniref:sensor histidine kinase n=1 Tax=Demequina flava TaxID=1095025 RepID=UPI00078482C1|nr:histidine kinase [Demequina flava]
MTSAPTAPAHRPSAALRLWDVGLYVIGFFVTTIAVMNVPASWNGDEATDTAALLWIIGLIAWVSVFFRRSHPLIAVIAGAVLALLGAEYLLFLIGVHHVMVAATPRRRMAWGAGAAGVVALFWVREALTVWGDQAALETDGGSTGDVVLTGVIALGSLGALYALTAVVVGRRTTEQQRKRADAEHTLATELGDELARQSERSDLAREIHDGLTNRLALVSMMSANVERAIAQGDPRAAELNRELQAQVRNALTDVRALVQDLRTEPAAPPAPRMSMRSVGEIISATRTAGTPVDAIVILDGAADAPDVLDATVYRLVQETLTNAVKHAPGHAVSLYLEAGPTTGVRLRVANPVSPRADASAAKGAGAGLVGIRERAAALQGTVWAGEHGGEFIVDVTLPWLTHGEPQAADVSAPDPNLGS